MMYLKERRDIVERLGKDEEFRSLYEKVMEAEKVTVKKKTVREVLRWLRVRERVNVEPEPETAPEP